MVTRGLLLYVHVCALLPSIPPLKPLTVPYPIILIQSSPLTSIIALLPPLTSSRHSLDWQISVDSLQTHLPTKWMGVVNESIRDGRASWQ